MPARPYFRSRARRIATLGVTVSATVLGAAALCPVSASASGTPESDYLAAINQERADHGLRPLVERRALDAVAESWSEHMADSQNLAHNPQLSSAVSNWQVVGENVGVGGDIQSLDRAFWNSPLHRANILDSSYADVGLGAVTRDGVIWITIDFRDPLHAVSAPGVGARGPAAHRPAHRAVRTAHSPSRPRHQQTRHQHRVLRVGSQGRDVARVQLRLHVTADGLFGPVTRGAVQNFQRNHEHRPTGVVGPHTWRAITR